MDGLAKERSFLASVIVLVKLILFNLNSSTNKIASLEACKYETLNVFCCNEVILYELPSVATETWQYYEKLIPDIFYYLFHLKPEGIECTNRMSRSPPTQSRRL